MAVRVEGDGSNSVVGFERGRGGFGGLVVAEFVAGEGEVGQAGTFFSLGLSEAFALAVEDKLGVVDEGHTVGGGELLGSLGDEVDVRAFVEDEAGGLDGVAQALDTGDSAGAEGVAVHDEGVELDAAVAGEEAATSSVEGGVVFEFGDGGFDSVDGGGSALEERLAGLEGVKDSLLVGLEHVVGDGPGSAVNDEDGAAWHRYRVQGGGGRV